MSMYVSKVSVCAFVHMRANPPRRLINPMRKMLPYVFYALFCFLQDVKRRLAGHSSTRCGAGLRRAEGVKGEAQWGGQKASRVAPGLTETRLDTRVRASDLELEDLTAGRSINLHRRLVSSERRGRGREEKTHLSNALS